MLMDVKMQKIVGILTFMSMINSVLSWVWKKFYNLGSWLLMFESYNILTTFFFKINKTDTLPLYSLLHQLS